MYSESASLSKPCTRSSAAPTPSTPGKQSSTSFRTLETKTIRFSSVGQSSCPSGRLLAWYAPVPETRPFAPVGAAACTASPAPAGRCLRRWNTCWKPRIRSWPFLPCSRRRPPSATIGRSGALPASHRGQLPISRVVEFDPLRDKEKPSD
jgi:hypothetical protein